MKDIVKNRSHISLGQKLRLGLLTVRENGLWWCLMLGTYYASSAVADKAFRGMSAKRARSKLPGVNSLALNKEIWNAWDWSAGGEEWTPSPEWKTAVIDGILVPNVAPGSAVVEIGPGGGRWTEILLGRAASYRGIDVSASAVDACNQRFRSHPDARFLVGTGQDLRDIADSSADVIWSFDVFVHINSSETHLYVEEFGRVLRPGGVAVIHHGGVGGKLGGWRSNVTQETFVEFVRQAQLTVDASFAEWVSDGHKHGFDTYGDFVTIIRKPAV